MRFPLPTAEDYCYYVEESRIESFTKAAYYSTVETLAC